jgi:uncharacterized damage-inducible protein DinB
MDSRIAVWRAIASLNTRLFANCLADVVDDLARQPVAPGTNPMSFVALHLVDARHAMVSFLGRELPRPFDGRFDLATSAVDIDSYPTVVELGAAWTAVSTALDAALVSATGERLDRIDAHPFAFPINDRSTLGCLAFLLQHESYHLGQLALLRKQHGLPAMTWR